MPFAVLSYFKRTPPFFSELDSIVFSQRNYGLLVLEVHSVSEPANRQDMDHHGFAVTFQVGLPFASNWDWMTIPDFAAAQKPRDADRHDEPS